MTRSYRVAIMMGSMHLLGACLAVGTPREDRSEYLPLRRPATGQRPRVAALVTSYYLNSHADVLVSRLVQTHTLDGQGEKPGMDLVALYMDQVSDRDLGLAMMKEHGVPVYATIGQALTLGSGRLAVDGVLLIAEHGQYPRSETGQIMYPKRRFFDETIAVFRDSGEVVPLFCDKHLADTWEDARFMVDTARRMGFPMMAGSSLPALWRRPAADIGPGERVDQMVAVSYHTLDAYGFHALEMVQCLVEHRAGGESGIRAVQTRTGEDVWRAGEQGVYDPALLEAALEALPRRLWGNRTIREAVREPVLFSIEHADGLRVHVFTLNGAVGEWAVAWRPDGQDTPLATYFETQEARPFMHFAYQLKGIEQMMQTGRPTWPVERTLLTSGTLDFLLRSKLRGGERIETPELMIPYRTNWRWESPPPPPPVHR
jgi:hypothetical protein